MNVADFLIEKLTEYNVTDIFGIPGGVILDLLYAAEKSDKVSAHLCYHEQGAAFAASGYAQVNSSLGVAYATRGPGFTNLITGIADAYQESIPVLFITAHSECDFSTKMRMASDQELDTISIVTDITKYAVRIDTIDKVSEEIQKACETALNGRMGPVLIDICSSLWNKEILHVKTRQEYGRKVNFNIAYMDEILTMFHEAQRPIILAGAGIRLSNTVESIKRFSEKHRIPILSSRGSQDLFSNSKNYFGYIGSHGIRYSNFILSKTDLIFSLGNRMSFPLNSQSFMPIFSHAKTIRVDIDKNEFNRYIPNSISYHADLKTFVSFLSDASIINDNQEWLSECCYIKKILDSNDTEYPVNEISMLMKSIPLEATLISDVGNNEFWVSRAYTYSGITNRILYSYAFGSLGNALPKAIGTYYKTKKPVVCFVGDQGMQLNMQELQTISDNALPILIVLLNNQSSGMIRSREVQKYHSQFVHTTIESGYTTPDFRQICLAYNIEYLYSMPKPLVIDRPLILELNISDAIDLTPYIPIGSPCQDMYPKIDNQLFIQLNNI